MLKHRWSEVKKEHVDTAIKMFLAEYEKHPPAQNTYLIHHGRLLPAKHIRGLAYKVAFNQEFAKTDYTGGKETADFFLQRGFRIRYKGEILEPEPLKEEPKIIVKQKISKPKKVKLLDIPTEKKIKISAKGVIEQKNALQKILNKLYDCDIVSEKTFEWMRTPSVIDGDFKKVYDSLVNYREDKNFAKKNMTLRCDFVCEGQKIIFEYDERQHFTQARYLALNSYPEIPTFFDRALWLKACADIQANDRQPINRDEGRAYYDSVRDIQAYLNGYKLIRIMHGQIDFTAADAEERLKLLISENPVIKTKKKQDKNKNDDLKIALYLQTNPKKNKADFNKAVSAVQDAEADIMVFPECCYIPEIEDALKRVRIVNGECDFKEQTLFIDLSKKLKCAVVVSVEKYNGSIYSIYANAFAAGDETKFAVYLKHTMTGLSPFEMNGYKNWYKKLFEPIKLKGYTLGLTICYDCNHAVFSRMYGLQNVDIILNSTGGNVIYNKWYRYSAARAIENNCYTFSTMGYDEKGNSYVFGFNRNGKPLDYKLLNSNAEDAPANVCGGVYLYTINNNETGYMQDITLNQAATESKYKQLKIAVGNAAALLTKAKKIEDSLFVLQEGSDNIVICVVENDDIFYIEKFLYKLYSPALTKYKNKRYIIFNKFTKLTKEIYENKLSLILKVRAMENYCAVILESNYINMCYQSTDVRHPQVVKEENGTYYLDLGRMTGPEAIWKNKDGMKASWRKGFEFLLNEIK